MIIARFTAPDAPHGETFSDLILLQLRKNRENPNHGAAEGAGRIEVFIDGNKIHTGSSM